MTYQEIVTKIKNGEPLPLTLKTFVCAFLYCLGVWSKTPRNHNGPRP